MRKILTCSVLSIALLATSGCARTRTQAKADPLAGVYLASGGGGAIFHVQALAARFDELHPGVVIQPENVGSDASIALVQNGGTDVGSISRDLKADEKTKVTAVPIGAVGTAVLENAANPVTGLTSDQVRKMFSGEITDWAEVGGPPGKIRVLIREKTASTRVAFEGYFFPDKPVYADDVAELHDIDQMTESVRSFKGAIGMATLEDKTLTAPGVKALAIDGVPGSVATLKDGSYPVRRNVALIYNPDPAKVKPAIRAFLDFAQSPEGRRALDGVNAQ